MVSRWRSIEGLNLPVQHELQCGSSVALKRRAGFICSDTQDILKLISDHHQACAPVPWPEPVANHRQTVSTEGFMTDSTPASVVVTPLSVMRTALLVIMMTVLTACAGYKAQKLDTEAYRQRAVTQSCPC